MAERFKDFDNVALSRFGSKKQDLRFFISFIPHHSTVKTIVEPFAGLFAVSRLCFPSASVSKVLVDNDASWCALIHRIKTTNVEDEFRAIAETMTDENHGGIDFTSKEAYLAKTAYINGLKLPSELEMIFVVRGRIRQKINFDGLTKLSTFLKFPHVQFVEGDGFEEAERFKDDPTAFIFLDPPYHQSDNRQYSQYNKGTKQGEEIQDNTVIFVKCLEMLQAYKARVMLVLNSNALMRHVFREYIKSEYRKTYQVTKKITSHIVCTNYSL